MWKERVRVRVEYEAHLTVMNLEEKVKEPFRVKELAEYGLRDRREYYERKLEERDAESENVECAVNGVIMSLQKQLEEGNILAIEHKEYCERKQQERDAESTKVVDTLNRVINRLQKEPQEAKSKHRDTLGRLYIMAAETRCDRDTANKRIKEVQNKVQEKECERDLNKKLYIRNSDKKEGESAFCGKMKKVVEAAVVMVVVLLMVVTFTNYGVIRG